MRKQKSDEVSDQSMWMFACVCDCPYACVFFIALCYATAVTAEAANTLINQELGGDSSKRALSLVQTSASLSLLLTPGPAKPYGLITTSCM